VGEDENGTLAVNYQEIVPVLIKAIQEQQAEIDLLSGGQAGGVQGAPTRSGVAASWWLLLAGGLAIPAVLAVRRRS
jgi:hypothetical protein